MLQSDDEAELQNMEADRRQMEAQLRPSTPKNQIGFVSINSPWQGSKSPLSLPLNPKDQHIVEAMGDEGSLAEVPRSDVSESQEVFYPSLEAQYDSHGSPKRKRIEVEEFSSSSLPETKDPKRQRRENYSLEKEVPSTPEHKSLENTVESPPIVEHTFGPEIITLDDTDEKEEEEDEELESIETNENELSLGREASPILSEPNRASVLTQAIFKEETPPIDLEVVPPEGGWDESHFEPESESESEPSSSSNQQNETTARKRMPQDIDTQALFNTETQIPSIDLPPPDGGWDPDLQSSPPLTTESHPAPPFEPSQSEINALLDAWIDARVEAGHPAADVEFALQRTSMDHDLADRVLAHMRSHGTVPDDMPGVWTEVDDEDLEASDGRRIMRLQAKHGSEALDTRWRYIEADRNCGG